MTEAVKSISEALSDLREEEQKLVQQIADLNTESAKLMLESAKGSAAAKERRREILVYLQTANQDLKDTRSAIAAAIPQVKLEVLQESAARSRNLTAYVASCLEARTPLAKRVDELVGELAAAVGQMEKCYSEAMQATTRAMNPVEAMHIGWDHEQVAQGVIGNLMRLANWDESVLSSLSSNGLSLLRQAEPIAEVAALQGARLLGVRDREQARIEDALAIGHEIPQEPAVVDGEDRTVYAKREQARRAGLEEVTQR